jgi:hypothetical protein
MDQATEEGSPVNQASAQHGLSTSQQYALAGSLITANGANCCLLPSHCLLVLLIASSSLLQLLLHALFSSTRGSLVGLFLQKHETSVNDW